MDRVQAGKLCLTSALLSCARASLFIAVRYAQQRLTFAPGSADVPVIRYRNHQLSLFGGLATVYAMSCLLNATKAAYANASRDEGELNRLTAVTKAIATWNAAHVINQCRERCGAQGMFSVNRIADYLLMTQGVITAEGDNEVILSKAAGELMALRRTTSPGSQLDPNGRDLLDERFILALLKFRESVLCEETSQVFHAQLRGNSDVFSAWNDNINAALSVAHAHGARLAFEEFSRAASEMEVASNRAALRLLVLFYGLQELSKAAAWFLNRGALLREHVERLPRAIDELCVELLPHASNLVEGFSIPNTLLRAPIASEDYVASFDFRFGGAESTTDVVAVGGQRA
jgi:acyl-CoA oxidase